MVTITVGEFFRQRSIPDSDAVIYVLQADGLALYVGKSEDAGGLGKRLDNHFWLQRRAGGNYFPVYVQPSHLSAVRTLLKDHTKAEKQINERCTRLHVWTTAVPQVTQLLAKQLVDLQNKDPMASEVWRRMPEAVGWEIAILALDDSRPMISQLGREQGQALTVTVANAEKAAIAYYRPTINIQHN